jgi:disulfide bond formation protein DsbB
VFHAGVEWAFWEGPASCSPSVGIGSAADMVSQLENTHAPSCTEATWRLLGLSFAGWNAVISLALVALALAGVRALSRRP